MIESNVTIFKKILLNDPFFIYPMLAVLICAILLVLLSDGPLHNFIGVIFNFSVFAQWVGIYLSHRKRKKERMKEDQERVESLTKNPIEMFMVYFVEYKPWPLLKIWNKICGKHSMWLYIYPRADSGSITTFRVSHKMLFEMKLNGFVGASTPATANKGFLFLKKNGILT